MVDGEPYDFEEDGGSVFGAAGHGLADLGGCEGVDWFSLVGGPEEAAPDGRENGFEGCDGAGFNGFELRCGDVAPRGTESGLGNEEPGREVCRKRKKMTDNLERATHQNRLARSSFWSVSRPRRQVPLLNRQMK